ncbi:hypothetical protein CPB85DRAFT_1253481 [Mucidula mucida]|nr:hypothetical protein CPB85DRAFT_1253481 [Mucidula mucida]
MPDTTVAVPKPAIPRNNRQSTRPRPPKEDSKRPACGYFNHQGCFRKRHCYYRHFADTASIPDSRRKNVCYHFIMGDCKFLDGTCWYSHCLKYLGPSKKKAQALATRREAAGKGTDVDKLLERMKAVKQSGDYEPDTQGYKVRVRQSDGSVAFEWSSDDDESVESIVGPYGYAQDNVDLLMEQGIKPWDDEADAALSVLSYY